MLFTWKSETEMGKRNYAVIADHLSLPIDEGLKKVTFELMQYASSLGNVDLFSSPENIGIRKVSIYRANKLMFSREIYNFLHKKNYTDIIYIPEASTTFYSFVRAWMILLQVSNKSKVFIVNSQERELKKWQLDIISSLKRIKVICFSPSSSVEFRNHGIKTLELPCGVDINVFKPISNQRKLELKNKYNLPCDKAIVLHVGHIRKSRNVSMLKCLQENNFQVVVVGSTSMAYENDLAKDLLEVGVKLFSEYNPNVEELYQLCDLYVFPVLLSDAAIEFPLSVLEAMSCGIPVLTTKFGALADTFKESSCFGFFDNEDDLIIKAKEFVGREASINRDIVEKNFTWENTFSKLFEE